MEPRGLSVAPLLWDSPHIAIASTARRGTRNWAKESWEVGRGERMAGRKIMVGEMKADNAETGLKPRAAYYEDYAKPVLVNWPFMLVAGIALLFVGHFVNRNSGRRLGGDFKKKRNSKKEDDSGSIEDGRMGRRQGKGNGPMSLAELRALRAEAAEARARHGASTSSSGPEAVKPRPLGSVLLLAKKVDKLEEETSQFFDRVRVSDDPLDVKEEKELARLLELLTQVQVEIDGVQSDESARAHRRTQTNRVQKLILALEGLGKDSS